jgi:hypothetical protein
MTQHLQQEIETMERASMSTMLSNPFGSDKSLTRENTIQREKEIYICSVVTTDGAPRHALFNSQIPG